MLNLNSIFTNAIDLCDFLTPNNNKGTWKVLKNKTLSISTYVG